MSERKEACQTCRFWELNRDEADRKCHADDQEGRCRRSPPVHLPAVVQLFVVSEDEQHEGEHGEKMDEGAYDELVFEHAHKAWSWRQPSTCGGDWCGEYQPKAEPQEGDPCRAV